MSDVTSTAVTAAKVEITYEDGRTEVFELDTRERKCPIGFALQVENDIHETDNGMQVVMKPGVRRRVSIQLIGRGPNPSPEVGS